MRAALPLTLLCVAAARRPPLPATTAPSCGPGRKNGSAAGPNQRILETGGQDAVRSVSVITSCHPFTKPGQVHEYEQFSYMLGVISTYDGVFLEQIKAPFSLCGSPWIPYTGRIFIGRPQMKPLMGITIWRGRADIGDRSDRRRDHGSDLGRKSGSSYEPRGVSDRYWRQTMLITSEIESSVHINVGLPSNGALGRS
jgi:hypothetical protein